MSMSSYIYFRIIQSGTPMLSAGEVVAGGQFTTNILPTLATLPEFSSAEVSMK